MTHYPVAAGRSWISKRMVSALLVVLCMGAAILLSRTPTSSTAPTESPQAVIQAMIEAAQRGDVAGYTGCFSGPLQDELQRQAAAEPGGRFANSLRDELIGLKAFVTRDLVEQGPDDARCVLEYVLAERLERFQVRLQVSSGAWRIVELTSLGREVPQIPYGTPVYATPAPGKRESAIANPSAATPPEK